MAQFPRVTIHLEMTSTDLRSEFNEDVDTPLWEMDVMGKQFIENALRQMFGEQSGTEVNITRLDVSHDLDQREQVTA
jgi:hypothetical protein